MKNSRFGMVVIVALTIGAAEPKNCANLSLVEGISIDLENAALAGSGCMEGTAVVATDLSIPGLKITMNEYNLQAVGGGKKMVRKACTLAVPVTIGMGHRLILKSVNLILKSVNLSGQIAMSPNSSAKISMETWLLGVSDQGTVLSENLIGATEKDLLLASPAEELIMASACATDQPLGFTLRMNSSAMVKLDGSLDSDLAKINIKGSQIKLISEKCGGSEAAQVELKLN